MKYLIICTLITLFFSCKENHKQVDTTVPVDEPPTEKATRQKESKIDYNRQMVPGKRLGPIILNENATPVLDSLGTPDSADAAMGKALSTWNEDSDNLLTIYTTTKMGVENFSRIKAIRSLSPNYKTEDNLGVNSSLSEIERQFDLKEIGTFTFEGKDYTLYSAEEGIGFEIGDDKICNGIVIMEKGRTPDQFYLPFYPDLKKE